MTVVRLSNKDGQDDPSQGSMREQRRRRVKFLLLFPVLLVLTFVALSFNTDFIPSSSMEPTLVPGDHIVTMRAWIAYPFGSMPARGDIITFRMSPANQAADAQSDPEGSADAATQANGSSAGGSSKPEILIKRVVGLPGDHVQIIDNKIMINGKRLLEDYDTIQVDADNEQDYNYAVNEPLVVPPGQLFVLGDNRNNSDDGRFWGTLKRSNVLGKFVLKLFHQKVKDNGDAQQAGNQGGP